MAKRKISRFNSHKHTRFNRYTVASSKKKRGFSLYLIIPISALLALIVALILGNYLGEIATPSPNTPDEPSNGTPNAPPLLDAKQINGAFVTLEGIFDNTTQSVKAQIPTGTSAVSLTLFDSRGDPYYRSAVAEAFGNTCGELTLSRVFDALTTDSGTMYSSVLFPSSALLNEEGAKQSVMNAYEAALIEELAKAGACDIIITPFKLGEQPPTIDDEFISKLSSYVYTVRGVAPELRIGLALSHEYFSNTELTLTTEQLSKTVDFLALDLTAKTESEVFSEALSSAATSILRREVRILICENNSEELISILDKYSIHNRQIAAKQTAVG